MNGVRKKPVRAEKAILGIQAWDRESLVMSEEEFNEQLKMEGGANEKTPKSSSLDGGNAHNDTERG